MFSVCLRGEGRCNSALKEIRIVFWKISLRWKVWPFPNNIS